MNQDSDFKRRSIERLTLAVIVVIFLIVLACIGAVFVRYLMPWASGRACIGIISLSFL